MPGSLCKRMSFPRGRIEAKRGQGLSVGGKSLQLGVQWRAEGVRSAEVRGAPGRWCLRGHRVASALTVSGPERYRRACRAPLCSSLGFPLHRCAMQLLLPRPALLCSPQEHHSPLFFRVAAAWRAVHCLHAACIHQPRPPLPRPRPYLLGRPPPGKPSPRPTWHGPPS